MEGIKHTTIRNGDLFCLNCGGSHKMALPLPVDKVTKIMEAFNVLHANCKPTWKEPVVDHELPVREKAIWWWQHGERGASSETMLNFFTKQKDFSINYPHDPDDFKRCYKLLETVPEWKEKLNELRSLSPVWDRLVDHWEGLTLLVKDQLVNHKANGMYKLMKRLIEEGRKA